MTQDQQPTRVVPLLTLYGKAREAINVWGSAFGAEEVALYEENGNVRHAELRINGGPVYLTDFSPQPLPAFQPTPSISLHLEVPNGGEWMERAVTAGCTATTPWQQMAFGGFGRITDPFGVIWSFASPNRA